jgi:hypothetical protein
LNWQDRIINIYKKNLFEYSNKILDSIKKEIEDRKCIIETNHVGLNKQENNSMLKAESIPENEIKIANEGIARNKGNGKSLRQRRNENKSRPVLGTSLNGNSRRGNNGISRRGNNGNVNGNRFGNNGNVNGTRRSARRGIDL